MGCTNSAPAAKATVASPKAVPGSPMAPGVAGRGRAASNRSNGSSADGHTGKQPAVADNGLHTLTTSQSVVASDKLADPVFTLDVSNDLDDTNGGQQHDGSSPVSDPSAAGDASDAHSHHSSSHSTGLGRSSPRSRVNSGAGVGAGAGAAASPGAITYKLGERIGHGAVGQVYLALNKATGGLMAAKVVDVSRNQVRTPELRKEIRLLRELNHENIVKYIGTASKDGEVVIFTEWVSGGSLKDILGKFRSMGEHLVRTYAKQILAGLAHLHDHRIAHRDIKPGNVLVSSTGVVKLADFGASEQLHATDRAGTFTITGTPYYMSPELIRGEAGGNLLVADVWAVGCTLIELLTGSPPWRSLGFKSAEELLIHIAGCHTPPAYPEGISPLLREFLDLCFERCVERRQTVRQLLAHKWFKNDDSGDDDDGDDDDGDGDGADTVAPLLANPRPVQPSGTQTGRGAYRKFHTMAVTPQHDKGGDGDEDDDWSDVDEDEDDFGESDEENLVYGQTTEAKVAQDKQEFTVVSSDSSQQYDTTLGTDDISTLTATKVNKFLQRKGLRAMRSMPV